MFRDQLLFPRSHELSKEIVQSDVNRRKPQTYLILRLIQFAGENLSEVPTDSILDPSNLPEDVHLNPFNWISMTVDPNGAVALEPIKFHVNLSSLRPSRKFSLEISVSTKK